MFGCTAARNQKTALEGPRDNRMRNVRYTGDNVRYTDNVNVPPVRNVRTPADTRLAVADAAADRIVRLPEVHNANVIVTNRNAYVAVGLRDGVKGQLTDALERKIADEVRATDPAIQNVYVSTNPDFVDRMRDYTRKLREGRPVTGLFEEFTEVTRRVFPNAR